MNTRFGFQLIDERTLPEINSQGRFYRHVKTGAELVSLVNDDENKVFGISFCTPPADSTGIAHILEHSVLCGSRKYPVKDPFVQLLKGSLNTFLNAMTYPDKTVYPVASQNLQDFYNLVDVYLDAVFYPRLTPEILQQEGWHYELERLEDQLVYKGVVYNEMKGAYSSPDALSSEWSQRSLFPDTPYGVDSGGDPRHIPDLTYAAFKSFHERIYHPSNARILFHGDDDPDERLRLLDAYLGAFQPIVTRPELPMQPRFGEPRKLMRSFAASAQEADRAIVTVNWMLGEIGEAETALAFKILQESLIGTPAAPLHKALIDSGLGGGLAGSGLISELRQPMFSIGLKDIEAGHADTVEALVLDTLAGLARNGIDPLTLAAALNTVEFRLRENNTGWLPRGIAFFEKALEHWLYGRDPLEALAFEAPLAAIKARVAAGERYFEGLIERWFVTNPHRTRVLLAPDPQQGEREAAEEAARLAAARSAMSEGDLARVIAETRTLKRLQETPDTPEALAAIPTLSLADLPRRNKMIPIELGELSHTRVVLHDLFTSGILYLDLGFDLHALPAELLPYTTVFGRALLETGAGEEDFVALSQRIGRTTGGIEPKKWVSAARTSQATAAWLFLRAKVMPEKAGTLLDILQSLLTSAKLDDRDRIRQIVLEEKASLESALVPGGSRFAAMRLSAGLNEAGWVLEQIAGISQLDFLRRLAGDIDTNWPGVAASLERMSSLLVNRSAMVCNVTANAPIWRSFEPRLGDFLGALPRSSPGLPQWPSLRGPLSEGLTIPAKVNYVVKGLPLGASGYVPTGATAVGAHYLRTSYLWDKVRVQGGAYGGSCSFDRRSNLFLFSSYRDPNLLDTLDIYDRAASFLRGTELGEVELTRAIIGVIGVMDDYQLPDAKGYTSLTRYLAGDTDDGLQQLREEVLQTKPADFLAFADALDHVAQHGHVVVLGSQEALKVAEEARPGLFALSKVM